MASHQPAYQTAEPCELPDASTLRAHLPLDHLDSPRSCATASQHGRNLCGAAPVACRVQTLVLRSLLVKPLGIAGVGYRELTTKIDTSRSYATGEKIGRWTLYDQRPDEIITGADDKHLDFRVSVLRDQQTEGSARVVLSTGVMTHNAFGRAYLATILRFHRFGVTQLLTNASRGERV
ncbi:MAG: DUF2867 domain-containing protein [Caulobacteraceae bacterium]|nr:DUF2867 domain-containing protein [Caulobacteraceae bacterium]